MKVFYPGYLLKVVLLLLLLATALPGAWAQQAGPEISGRVTDEKGAGLPGVTIQVQGTTVGTSTDPNGKFTLQVPTGASTLVVSSVGLVAQTVNIDGRTQVNVTLKENTQALADVVVVGYGTQKKTDVTGAVASVSAQDIKDLPVASFTETLAGQVAGVQVQQTSGAPGGALTVRVRGAGSISAGNAPLYVVDGYPLTSPDDINLINPNDIASLEVLKDASAAAIYGSRGGNGVVIITTKRGKAGQPKIELNYYIGQQRVAKKLDMLDAAEFTEFSREAFNNAWIDRGGQASDPNSIRPDGQRLRYPDSYDDPASLVNTDWQDQIFHNAGLQNYQLSVSGGGEKSQYLISANYFNQEGIIRESSFKRYSFRANVDATLSKRLKVGVNLAPSFSVDNRVSAENHWASDGIINGALSILPVIPVYNPDGTYASQVNYGFGMPGIPSPVAIMNEVTDRVNTLRVLGNMYAELELVPGFTFRTSLGADVNTNRRNYFRPSIVPANQQPAPTIAAGYNSSRFALDWLNENTLTYTKTFAEQHSLTALAGFTAQRAPIQERTRIDATGYPNDLVTTVNAASIRTATSDPLLEQWSLLSYLARINYGFRDKYLLTATIRRDGSSRFGADRRWGNFPSVSLGWRASQEEFLRGLTALNELKFRVSYGLTGNNFIPNYGAIGILAPENYSLGTGTANIVNGLGQQTVSNTVLTWEINRQFDAGLELGVLNNRLAFTADYYERNSSGLLLDVPVPSSTGFTRALQNIGKVRNRGVELALISRNLTGAFTWTTNLNLSLNRNKVLALGPQGDPIFGNSSIGNTHLTQIGQPLGSFFGYVQEGIFQNQAELDATPHFADARPGDVRFQDVNGDGQITPTDRTLIGNNQPDFIYGFTNAFAYKNFDLNIITQGVEGNEILNLSLRFYENLEGNANQRSAVLDRWRSPEQPGNGVIPRANSRTTGSNNQVSTRWVEDGSFFRIRNITLGYSLPTALVKKAFIQSARLYTSIQNLATFTKYQGYNPEVNLAGEQTPTNTPSSSASFQALTPGTDYGGYPLSRTFTLGVNLGF
ncbi:SusC/RagA family TonB-linked outer membrane protein [uncultured Hymenobacter sp.]|uniref:SusC/RagA family TonB-linked outer membrane protein n=1 Tax=uncultured Hymenobacter sp. TaxID=170016 RepID=UPI0035C950C2